MIKEPFLTGDKGHLNGENNKKFIEENKELIKNCIRRFLDIVKTYYPNSVKSNEKYEFSIDSRWKRRSIPIFHKDGDTEFLLFIYPKKNPTGTYIGKKDIGLVQKRDIFCDEVQNNSKILPKIDQCDSIIIHNKTQKHASPNISFKESNEEENMALIRFSMTERKHHLEKER